MDSKSKRKLERILMEAALLLSMLTIMFATLSIIGLPVVWAFVSAIALVCAGRTIVHFEHRLKSKWRESVHGDRT